jgi:hypothetical protein
MPTQQYAIEQSRWGWSVIETQTGIEVALCETEEEAIAKISSLLLQ